MYAFDLHIVTWLIFAGSTYSRAIAIYMYKVSREKSFVVTYII